MKALVLKNPQELDLEDVPTPHIGSGEVLIRTAYAGICGTDRDLYLGLPGSAKADPPIILGHENSGRIAYVGSQVTGLAVGDNVAVDPNIYCHQCNYCRSGKPGLCSHLSAIGVTRNGGMAEYFSAPAEVVYKVPNGVALREASMMEPISCAVHGVNLMALRPNQKALVIGDGFMGQLFAQILQCYGLVQVDLAGISAEKLALGRRLSNIHATYKTDCETLPVEAYDLVVEAAGLPATQAQAIQACRRGAQVLMFGVGAPDAHFTMNTYDIYQKELTIKGSFINPLSCMDAVSLLESGRLNISDLISHELKLEQVPALMEGKIGETTKALVTFPN